ncbi:DUF2969 family protein [Weissella halotolerans]|uniref:DUF2969 family protein n=1 Tax=Weissella halotolerans TaxID=1615 RepID=UPI0003B6E2C7|nr:DUF2969 family protein [Weissella halotolerans]
MARKNKPVSVEIIEQDQDVSEVKVNKVSLGLINEHDGVEITFHDGRKSTVADFDEGVSRLIADYNLHH